jgi:hypothetical protein
VKIERGALAGERPAIDRHCNAGHERSLVRQQEHTATSAISLGRAARPIGLRVTAALMSCSGSASASGSSGLGSWQVRPRIMHPASAPEFQVLRTKMESEWTSQMMQLLDISRESLPIIWDADFLLWAS